MSKVKTEDIFEKAAFRYCERIGDNVNLSYKTTVYRNELADLCERILALRDVGALPREIKGEDNAG